MESQLGTVSEFLTPLYLTYQSNQQFLITLGQVLTAQQDTHLHKNHKAKCSTWFLRAHNEVYVSGVDGTNRMQPKNACSSMKLMFLGSLLNWVGRPAERLLYSINSIKLLAYL